MSPISLSPLRPVLDRLRSRSDISSEEAEALLALPHRLSTLDPRAYIVREGDRTGQCCALLKGFALRHKTVGSGARQILSVNIRGDLLDLQNCLLDQADHSVQTLSQAEVAFIPKQEILDLCRQFPSIARAFWVETLVDASISREWIANVGRRSARERIAHLFCEIALRQEAAGICDGPNYVWPMTQEQVGDAAGLTSVHVNRVLQGLRTDRLIKTTKQSVTVLDWANLQNVGDFSRDYLHLPRRPSGGDDGPRKRYGEFAPMESC